MKVKNVIRFYLLATTLKNKIRQGLIKFNVTKERLESVAEHIYGTCILAIALDSEFELNINIDKVIKMLVVHELEEIIIGDIPVLNTYGTENTSSDNEEAVLSVLGDLVKKEEYINLINEFDSRSTNESKFAYMCDKLECDLQIKVYDEEGYCSLDNLCEETRNNSRVKELIDEGASTISQIFNDFDKSRYVDSPLFQEMLNYIKNNKITELLYDEA